MVWVWFLYVASCLFACFLFGCFGCLVGLFGLTIWVVWIDGFVLMGLFLSVLLVCLMVAWFIVVCLRRFFLVC